MIVCDIVNTIYVSNWLSGTCVIFFSRLQSFEDRKNHYNSFDFI